MTESNMVTLVKTVIMTITSNGYGYSLTVQLSKAESSTNIEHEWIYPGFLDSRKMEESMSIHPQMIISQKCEKWLH